MIDKIEDPQRDRDENRGAVAAERIDDMIDRLRTALGNGDHADAARLAKGIATSAVTVTEAAGRLELLAEIRGTLERSPLPDQSAALAEIRGALASACDRVAIAHGRPGPYESAGELADAAVAVAAENARLSRSIEAIRVQQREVADLAFTRRRALNEIARALGMQATGPADAEITEAAVRTIREAKGQQKAAAATIANRDSEIRRLRDKIIEIRNDRDRLYNLDESRRHELAELAVEVERLTEKVAAAPFEAAAAAKVAFDEGADVEWGRIFRWAGLRGLDEVAKAIASGVHRCSSRTEGVEQ